MPIESWGKSGVLAYFWLKIAYSGHIFWDMDFKFVLPIIYIDIKGKIQLEVNWTQIDHFGSHKTIKVAISQFAFLRKTRLLKTLRLLHFSIFFHEIFRINVELNFALNLLLGFLKNFSEKNKWPNSEIPRGNFRIWPLNFFRRIKKKSK